MPHRRWRHDACPLQPPINRADIAKVEKGTRSGTMCLQHAKLKRVPVQLMIVKKMYLDHDELKRLPEDFGNLFNIYGSMNNELSCLPASIDKRTNQQLSCLCSNYIQELPGKRLAAARPSPRRIGDAPRAVRLQAVDEVAAFKQDEVPAFLKALLCVLGLRVN